jgi:glycogen debranching enzyme
MRRIAAKTKFGQSSWDPDMPSFESQRYWCGPIWCQMNFMIAKGLAEQGEGEMAAKMRDDLGALITQSGFYECFDPVTGDGCIGTDFSWTAALWLAWASPSLPRSSAA